MLFHFALNAMQPSVQLLNHGALKELQNSLTVKSVTEKQSLLGRHSLLVLLKPLEEMPPDSCFLSPMLWPHHVPASVFYSHGQTYTNNVSG